jgi:hypothetical protein
VIPVGWPVMPTVMVTFNQIVGKDPLIAVPDGKSTLPQVVRIRPDTDSQRFYMLIWQALLSRR